VIFAHSYGPESSKQIKQRSEFDVFSPFIAILTLIANFHSITFFVCTYFSKLKMFSSLIHV